MSKPYFDQISILIKLRREKRTMDKVLRAYTRLHDKDSIESYERNLVGFELLDDVRIIQPNVDKALEEEKQMFLELMEKASKFYISETGNPIRHLSLGGWWYKILGEPCKLFLTGGEVEIEPVDRWENSYSEGCGDGICSSISNVDIKITLLGDLTHEEAYIKQFGRSWQ